MPEDPIDVVVVASPPIDAEIEAAAAFEVQVSDTAPIEVVVESPDQNDQTLVVESPPEIIVQLPPQENIDLAIETPPEILVQIMEAGEASGVSRWRSLQDSWTVAPHKIASLPDGSVWEYGYGSTLYYRMVPTPYSTLFDQFFTTFNNPTLSGLLATKGQII